MDELLQEQTLAKGKKSRADMSPEELESQRAADRLYQRHHRDKEKANSDAGRHRPDSEILVDKKEALELLAQRGIGRQGAVGAHIRDTIWYLVQKIRQEQSVDYVEFGDGIRCPFNWFHFRYGAEAQHAAIKLGEFRPERFEHVTDSLVALGVGEQQALLMAAIRAEMDKVGPEEEARIAALPADDRAAVLAEMPTVARVMTQFDLSIDD